MLNESNKNIWAILSFILALISLFFGFYTAILGIIFGIIALIKIKENPSLGGKKLAIAGIIISIIIIIIVPLLVIIGGLAYFGVINPFGTSPSNIPSVAVTTSTIPIITTSTTTPIPTSSRSTLPTTTTTLESQTKLSKDIPENICNPPIGFDCELIEAFPNKLNFKIYNKLRADIEIREFIIDDCTVTISDGAIDEEKSKSFLIDECDTPPPGEIFKRDFKINYFKPYSGLYYTSKGDFEATIIN
tara:strand:- start:1845 stop:2582 length:738 start_codon:yes stop_codon:yes gene_type:complete